MSGEACFSVFELLNVSFLNASSSNSADSDLNWNPLCCLLCKNALLYPVTLQCHHVFCQNCILLRRDKESNRLRCPMCGHDCFLPDSSVVCDPLIRYLVESANETTDVCANCDGINQPMFFCETCSQPLCNTCKEQTHQAKMFSTHKVVFHEERSGAASVKKCKNHGEPYILFCAENKSLVCINCFRTATMESRPHYLDLETAYRTARDKLGKMVKHLKSFQKEVSDSVLLHRSMLDELRKNTEREINQIQVICQQIMDKLIETRDNVLTQIKNDSMEREEHLLRQLNVLCALTPTVQLYLLLSSVFCSSAGKLDFLDFCYALSTRIQAIINENQCLQPSFSPHIQTNFKTEVARALELYLGGKSVLLPSTINRKLSVASENCLSSVVSTSGCFLSSDSSMTALSPSRSSGSSRQYNWSSNSSRSSAHGKSYSKLRLLVDLAGAFGDEYSKIDTELKDLSKRFAQVSNTAQEVQRDLTIRKCVIDEAKVSEVLVTSQKLKVDLGAHSTRVDDLQSTFQEIWEEQLDRVRKQQEIYKNHVTSVMCLREDLHRVNTACQQLAPFVRSIAQAIGQLAPERCRHNEPCPMQQICSQINTIEPNSQIRVDAIERQEQQRKQELEKKKLDSQQLIAGAKRKLKASKDPARRKSGHDFSHSASSCVKNVDRERNAVVETQQSQQQQQLNSSPIKSPNLEKHGNVDITSTSPKSFPFSRPVSAAGIADDDELNSSLERLLSVDTDLKNTAKGANHVTHGTQNIPVAVTATLSAPSNGENGTVDIEHAPQLPATHVVGDSGPIKSSPTKCCLPSTLIANVDSATLQARERVLASLKEKVRRIDTGPSSSGADSDP